MLLLVVLLKVLLFCTVLGNQGIRATGFKRMKGNKHCMRVQNRHIFKSITNKSMITEVHALVVITTYTKLDRTQIHNLTQNFP